MNRGLTDGRDIGSPLMGWDGRSAELAGGESSAGAGPSGPVPLGTYTHNLSPASENGGQWFNLQREKQNSRDERWELRRRFRKITESKRVRSCGRPGARDDSSVVLRATETANGRIAGYGGLFACGNVHVCMQCSSRIAVERAQEIERVIAHQIAEGGWAVLVTLTQRHGREHSLEQCLKAAATGWQAANSGKVWQADKAAMDYAGYVRALEVTESPENGWHVHYHLILCSRSRPDRDTLETVAEGMFNRWSRALVRAGLPAPIREYGLDVQHLELNATGEAQTHEWARYLAKGIAAESALGVTKEAKGGNRTIRQLMRDALVPQRWEDPKRGESGGLENHKVRGRSTERPLTVETIDLTARAKLHEYERGMAGRKVLTWSTGAHDLRKAAGLGAERSDEEIAEDDDLEGEDVAVLPRETWAAIEPMATELLKITEQHGPSGAREWLDARGLEWWLPTRLTQQSRHGEPPGH